MLHTYVLVYVFAFTCSFISKAVCYLSVCLSIAFGVTGQLTVHRSTLDMLKMKAVSSGMSKLIFTTLLKLLFFDARVL